MSEISANFVVESVQLGVTSETNNIVVDAEPISLNVFALGFTAAGGNNGELQFNNNGSLGGAENTSVSNGNVIFQNVSNIKIAGGTNDFFLQTDGTGNLTWAPGTANVTGIGTAAGANTQIQYTDGAGNFLASAGFTFDNSTNTFTTPGDAIISGDANVTGDVNAANVNAGNANVTGQLISTVSTGTPPLVVYSSSVVANLRAATANVANTVSDNAQPNITSVGTLTSLDITGNLSAGNANLGNAVTANYFIGNLNGHANTANTVTDNAQPNITSVGNLTSLIVTGNANANIINANYIYGDASNVSNVRSISNGNSNINCSTANGNIIVTVRGNTFTPTTFKETGILTFDLELQNNAIRLGSNSNVGTKTVAIGENALATNPGIAGVGIGNNAGNTNQGNYAVAIGSGAQTNNANAYAIAVGTGAGFGFSGAGQGANAIAIGYNTGFNNQGANSIAIGGEAGAQNQGSNSIAIGRYAAYSNQHANSIVLNATGANLNSPNTNSFTVKPIREAFGNFILYYNDSTSEITRVGTATFTIGNVLAANITSLGNINTNTFVCNSTANIVTANISNLTVTNNFNVTSYITISPRTVANLGNAVTLGAGTKTFVTDANTTTFFNIVGSGGTNVVPVFSDGNNWRVG